MAEPTIDPPVLDLLTRYLSQAKEHAVICLDPAGTIAAWLGAAERLFGHTAEEAVGQPVALIFTSEDKARGLDRYERLLAGVHSRSEDDRWHVRKDGTRIWVTGALEAVISALALRHGMAGQPASHGSMMHRRNGAIGNRSTPGRIWKNMGMPGHMGDERVTVQNLEVVRVDAQRNLLLVKGAVPGAPGGNVIVRPAVKASNKG